MSISFRQPGMRRASFAGLRWLLLALALAPAIAARAQSTASPFTTGFRFDAAQRLVGQIAPDPDGAGPLQHGAVRNTYDARGLLTRVEVGGLAAWQSEAVHPSAWSGFTVFRQTDYTYDGHGRKLSEQVSAGGSAFLLKQFSYDIVGRLDCTARRMNPAAFGGDHACTPGSPGAFGPDRIERVAGYDNSDRPLGIIRAYGAALQQNYATYTYTGAHRASSTDANGNVSTFHVDGFGRLEYWRFPSPTSVGQTSSTDFEKYSYDANGNRTQLQKRSGSVINYAYDALNRLIAKDLPGSAADVSYTYDLRGLQLTAQFSANGAAVTNEFDGFGRLIESTSTMVTPSRSIYSDYDANGNRTRITHDDGHYFDYAYDGLDRLTHICENPLQPCSSTANPVISLSYDPQGRRQQLTRGASVSVSSYGYDAVSRLSDLAHNLDGSSTVNDVASSFDFNPASQLVTRTLSNSAYEVTLATQTRGYAVNGLNQYTQITSPGAATVAHDANGNLTSDGASTFAYDTENRLTSASGARNATLVYDPKGRLFQTSGSTITQFLYDGDALIAEYDGAGSLKRRYVSGARVDEPLLWYEGQNVGAANRRYLHADHQGSIIAVANSAGATIEKETYDAYGVQGGANSSRFQYTGQANIPELGLYYYKARMYSPVLGRFMQTDPIGYEDDVNLYAYVRNDPLNLTDPSGRSPPGCGDGSCERYSRVSFVSGLVQGSGSDLLRNDVSGSYKAGVVTTMVLDAIKGKGESSVASSKPSASGSSMSEGSFKGGTPGIIYRSGGSNPGNLKPRKGEDGVSFRETMSNPVGGPEVMKKGKEYIGVDPGKLPAGSVTYDGGVDGNADGHVSVRAPQEAIKDAIVEKGRLPE